MMKWTPLLILVFIFTGLKTYSQCFCAEIKFQLLVPGAEDTKKKSNYRLVTVLPKEKSTLSKFQYQGDTVYFEFATGGGMEELFFIVEHLPTKKRMEITVKNINYDTPYSIDLTTFTPGHFCFDWENIEDCQKDHRNDSIVDCRGTKFYHSPFMHYGELMVNHRIKPFDLSYFKCR